MKPTLCQRFDLVSISREKERRDGCIYTDNIEAKDHAYYNLRIEKPIKQLNKK